MSKMENFDVLRTADQVGRTTAISKVIAVSAQAMVLDLAAT